MGFESWLGCKGLDHKSFLSASNDGEDDANQLQRDLGRVGAPVWESTRELNELETKTLGTLKSYLKV